jgi:putative salt-induced outer membrane protein
LAQGPEEAPPAGTGGQAAASGGATELEGQGKFGTATDPTADAAKEEESTDATEFSLAAGGILSTGNANSAAATAATNFRLRRGMHQATVIAAGNYGASKADAEAEEWEQTVGNVQGRARYDAFFARRWSAFLMVTARNDPFQGLDLRLNVDPGVAFYALPGPKNRLWFELGYDFQYDLRTDEAIVAKDADGEIILDMNGDTIRVEDKFFINHAIRAFAGYSNRMSDKVTFDTGFEWLQSVVDPKIFRFIFDVALTTQIAERFSLATTFTLRYENQPLPDIKKLDTITALNVVYRFF